MPQLFTQISPHSIVKMGEEAPPNLSELLEISSEKSHIFEVSLIHTLYIRWERYCSTTGKQQIGAPFEFLFPRQQLHD